MDILDENLKKIYEKYGDKLDNYKFIEVKEYYNIPIGSFLRCISKNNFFIKKGGYLKEVKDISLFAFHTMTRRSVWFLYVNEYYIFIKIPKKDKLKYMLNNLIKSDFAIFNKIE